MSGAPAGRGNRDYERGPFCDDDADPYGFARRCRIESAFPQVRDAYDLTLEEFSDRLAWLAEREAGPAGSQLAAVHRQMRRWSRRR